jgi:hypothetical protein
MILYNLYNNVSFIINNELYYADLLTITISLNFIKINIKCLKNDFNEFNM